MSRATTVRAACVALVTATLLLPTAALAQRGGGGGRGAGGEGRIISAPTTITGPGPIQVGPTPSPQFIRGSVGVRGHGHHHHRVGHHHHKNFFGKGFVGFAPAFGWGVPYYYPSYAQPLYDPGPTYVYAPTPPMQTVVEYPTGRYELRGDGYGTPYHWLWIPKPPSAPPTAPPTLQPAPETPPASTRPEPPGKTTVYRWTDAEGVVHFTDRLDSVPPRHRSPAAVSLKRAP